MKNGSQHAMKPPTTMLSVCAAFVSRFIDDIRIGIRFPFPLLMRFLPPVEHESAIDVWLVLKCTECDGIRNDWIPKHVEYLHVNDELRIVDVDFDNSTSSYNVWCESSWSNDFWEQLFRMHWVPWRLNDFCFGLWPLS